MIDTKTCLIEIGTEELPPKALQKLSAAFTAGVVNSLQQSNVAFSAVESFATPRRLAILIHELASKQPSSQMERRGPAISAAYDDKGEPTQAALGFARSCKTTFEALERLVTSKGEWLVYRAEKAGSTIDELLPAMVSQSLDKLPIPKRMRWGDRTVEFVRPVHWIVMLYGSDVINASILSIPAGQHTYGHRFHHPDAIKITSPIDYVAQLEEIGKVIPEFARRREMIREQVLAEAKTLGGVPVIRDALLDEVTALVEFPVALAGRFDERFLDVPTEALISSMEDHQRYFPVVTADGKLLPGFITVANVQSKNMDVIREGNERVILPRLADAAFFWEQDRKSPLESRHAGLKNLIFQDKLGSVYDKSCRVATLAKQLGSASGASTTFVERAAMLSKCDLLTAMVGEFPALQGIMGGYYAHHDQEPAEVAQAIKEQYQPRFAGDKLPETTTGALLALADKLDTLTAIFSLGLIPTGDRDPFALRRAALGIIRILIEKNLTINLPEMVGYAVDTLSYAGDKKELSDQVQTFILDRLRAYYLDQGVAVGVFAAVRGVECGSLTDFDARVKACEMFLELPEAEALSAANKRVRNILRKAELSSGATIDPALLVEPQELHLYERFNAIAAEVRQRTESGQDYPDALRLLAQLREPLDAFFESVMVMAEDPKIRDNRLTLLSEVSALFMGVADISRLFS